MSDRDHRVLRGDSGVLLRVGNGTAIGYDDTGLILRLSDKVVDDLRDRLSLAPGNGAGAGWIDPAVVGDIDAWNVTRNGSWYHFDAQLPGYPHPRRFRRPVAGGHVVADVAGPLLAVLSIGGARRARALPGRAAMAAHVLCPADDLGAVGLAGVELAQPTAGLEQAREVTLDTLVADALLAVRRAQGRALPLILARAETDASTSAAALAEGAAMANLEQTIDNTVAAAAALGVAPRIATVAIDYGAEDVISDVASHIAGIRAVMARISAKVASLGLHEPVFVMRADETGTRVREHWELSVFPGDHRLIFSAPGYAFAFDDTHRPTAEAMQAMARAEAQAIDAALSREAWHCPRLLLAETEAPGRVRVVSDALNPLVLDPLTLGAGGDHGFSLETGEGRAKITGVSLADDDDRALILAHDGAARVQKLHYAVGRAGGLCDMPGRWALPAILPVGQC
ncbi:hypothetical protein [Oceaniglobus trochenteri]|uniref:hypothetical protein n=1 Tax=Oceaniglobus trochenteri TaxID=2763260 RepID=UPI001CFF6676|nr:hypothetical protein [Oceaniglobus trochenteri]